MAALNETRNCADIQETFDGQGYLVKYDASGILKTAAVNDNPMGVTAAESSRNAAGSLEAAAQDRSNLPAFGNCLRQVHGNCIKRHKVRTTTIHITDRRYKRPLR